MAYVQMIASVACGTGGLTLAYKIETENVRIILSKMLDDMCYWDCEGKEAEKQLCYIAGMTDMANAIIKAIKELGGK